jgi:hypothetical protein
MESPQAARPALFGLAAVLLIGAALAYYAHARLPYSEPDVTARAIFSAAGGGDLVAFKEASTHQFYTTFVEVFGEAKYQRVEQIYDQVQRLGRSRWLEVRQRAVAGALEAYDQLRAHVTALGREELAKLPVEQRLQLLDQQGSDAFIELGLSALPADQRRLIRDVEAFRAGRDRNDFAQAQAWEHASADDKKSLGSAAALSSENTAEKLAFLDRVGVPLLEASVRAELGEIQRSELQDPAVFKFKYGEPLARDYLGQKRIPAIVTSQDCGFVRADSNGGLLLGTESACVVQTPIPGQSSPLALIVELRKVEVRWLVSSVNPPLYAVWPPATGR